MLIMIYIFLLLLFGHRSNNYNNYNNEGDEGDEGDDSDDSDDTRFIPRSPISVRSFEGS